MSAVRAEASSKGIKKVVLAYSGGLDTSVILKWLQDTYNCEVVTFTADLGQVCGHVFDRRSTQQSQPLSAQHSTACTYCNQLNAHVSSRSSSSSGTAAVGGDSQGHRAPRLSTLQLAHL